MHRSFLFKSLTAVAVLSAALLASCGGGSSKSDGPPTQLEGTLVDGSQHPVPNATFFVFETYENSTTDDQGAYSLASYKHLDSAKFFFQMGPNTYTNTVDIGTIPSDVVTVRTQFMLTTKTNELTVTRVDFDTTQGPTKTPVPEPTAQPGDTPAPGATPAPGKTPAPQKTPKPTPTKKPGNFDSNGSTSAFGIPHGKIGRAHV